MSADGSALFFFGNSMLDAIRKIRRIHALILQECEAGHRPFKIDHIRDAIIRLTDVDTITYNRFDDPDNAIVGRYYRFSQRSSVYSILDDRVIVYVRTGLDEKTERFVVCKEMCHAFDGDCHSRIAKFEDLTKLASGLILQDSSRELISTFPPFASEKWANFVALEIMCPIKERRTLLEADYSVEQISDIFMIPMNYAKLICQNEYMEIIDKLLRDDFDEPD